MVDERVMKFRLGVVAIASVVVAVTLVLLLGRTPELLKNTYQVHVKFEDASGVSRGTPVRKFGILIGRAVEIGFAGDGDGALVTLEIDSEVRLRTSETFCINKGMFGDAVIEVIKKQAKQRAAKLRRV
jgi:phospholipid/cholesterol/gamma-HCH transport system substrate-binding protein